jgi:alpha-galactosidase/6-phospho-beta-glucosidase family protein
MSEMSLPYAIVVQTANNAILKTWAILKITTVRVLGLCFSFKLLHY